MNALALPKKILARARQILPKKQENLIVKTLWIDHPDANAQLEKLTCDPAVKACIADIIKQGYGVIKGAVSHDDCDALIKAFKTYCDNRPDGVDYKDKNGFYERLANFHQVAPETKKLYQQPQVAELLNIILEEKPKIIGSLFFEKSTEQDFHRDTPTFFTNPINHYFGVWFALEDIDGTQGPLRYYAGSHRIADDITLRQSYDNSDDYQAALLKLSEDAGLKPEEFHPEKGDVLIWHPQLFHAGCPRKDENSSRYSMVYHWMASSASINPPSDFFSGESRFTHAPKQFVTLDGGIVSIDHGKPRFFHNRKEGNFDEFD